MRKIIWIWAVGATLWAIAATAMHFRNPLPFPDHGHRAYGVPDERARKAVVKMLEEVTPLRERFTFDSGATHQTLMWDGFTVIHYLDSDIQKARDLTGNGLSVAVDDPQASAKRAVELLQAEGYKAAIIEGINYDLPENSLVPVESDAFNGWALVFRRQLIKMPYPKIRK
jgi:hypothetical protein